MRRARQGGVELVILRERTLPKKALGALLETLLPLREQGLKLVIGRRLDLARAYALDGVQLAADAIPVREARAWLGPDALIGYSAHSVSDLADTTISTVDYLTVSPIYAPISKPGSGLIVSRKPATSGCLMVRPLSSSTPRKVLNCQGPR